MDAVRNSTHSKICITITRTIDNGLVWQHCSFILRENRVRTKCRRGIEIRRAGVRIRYKKLTLKTELSFLRRFPTWNRKPIHLHGHSMFCQRLEPFSGFIFYQQSRCSRCFAMGEEWICAVARWFKRQQFGKNTLL